MNATNDLFDQRRTVAATFFNPIPEHEQRLKVRGLKPTSTTRPFDHLR